MGVKCSKLIGALHEEARLLALAAALATLGGKHEHKPPFPEKKCTRLQTLTCLLALSGGLLYSAAKEPKRTKYVKKAVTQKTVSSLRLL